MSYAYCWYDCAKAWKYNLSLPLLLILSKLIWCDQALVIFANCRSFVYDKIKNNSIELSFVYYYSPSPVYSEEMNILRWYSVSVRYPCPKITYLFWMLYIIVIIESKCSKENTTYFWKPFKCYFEKKSLTKCIVGSIWNKVRCIIWYTYKINSLTFWSCLWSHKNCATQNIHHTKNWKWALTCCTCCSIGEKQKLLNYKMKWKSKWDFSTSSGDIGLYILNGLNTV